MSASNPGYMKISTGPPLLHCEERGDKLEVVRVLHSQMDANQHLKIRLHKMPGQISSVYVPDSNHRLIPATRLLQCLSAVFPRIVATALTVSLRQA